MSCIPSNVFMAELDCNYENTSLHTDDFVSAADSLLEELSSHAYAVELNQLGISSPGSTHRSGSHSVQALELTKRLRHVLSQAFGGSKELCVELLGLVHFRIYDNPVLGLLILEQLRHSLAEGPAGPLNGPRYSSYASPPLGDVGITGDVLLPPLGPTATDLPLVASIYNASPDGCGHAALQAVVEVSQRCSQRQLRSWFAAYSKAELTSVTEWLLEAALGWLAAPLTNLEVCDVGDDEPLREGHDGEACAVNVPLAGSNLARAGLEGGAAASKLDSQQRGAQPCARARCGAMLLSALAWSCPQLARSLLAVMLDRLGAPGEAEDPEDGCQEQRLDEEEGVFDVAVVPAYSDIVAPAAMGPQRGRRGCLGAILGGNAVIGSPLWEVLQAIIQDLARVLRVQDRLKAPEAGQGPGPLDVEAGCAFGGGASSLPPQLTDLDERIRLVSELCGDDMDDFENLLLRSLELLRLLEEHTPFVTSMRPTSAMRLIRLLAPLLPFSEYMAETLLLGVTAMASDAAAAAAAADAAADTATPDAGTDGANGMGSPTRLGSLRSPPGRSRLSVPTPARSPGSSDGSRRMLGTPGFSQTESAASLGTQRESSPAVSSLCSVWLMHHLSRTPVSSSGDSEVTAWPSSSRAAGSSAAPTAGAVGSGADGVLPVAIGLSVEVLCAVFMYGRCLPPSLGPLYVKLLEHVLQLASRRGPLECCGSSSWRRQSGSAPGSGGAASRAPGTVSAWVLSRLQSALTMEVDTGGSVSGVADGADPRLLCADALAAALRACLYSSNDLAALHVSHVASQSPSPRRAQLFSEGPDDEHVFRAATFRDGGSASAPRSPQYCPKRPRGSLRSCIRWRPATVERPAGRAARRGSSRADREGHVAGRVLVAPPVAAFIGSLGQALVATANRDDMHRTAQDPRNGPARSSFLHSPAGRVARGELDGPVAVLAEVLVLSVFGDRGPAACHSGRNTFRELADAIRGAGETAVGCSQPQAQLGDVRAPSATAAHTRAEVAALVQLRMQVVAALAVLLTRVPDCVSLAVLSATAPLLHQSRQPGACPSATQAMGPRPVLAAVEGSVLLDSRQRTVDRIAVTGSGTAGAAGPSCGGGCIPMTGSICNAAAQSLRDPDSSSAGPSGAAPGTMTASEVPTWPCAAAASRGVERGGVEAEAAVTAAGTVNVRELLAPSHLPYSLTTLGGSSGAGDQLRAAQDDMRAVIETVCEIQARGFEDPQRPLPQAGASVESPSACVVSAAQAALLACHNALQAELSNLARPADPPPPPQQPQQPSKEALPLARAMGAAPAGLSHAIAASSDRTAAAVHANGKVADVSTGAEVSQGGPQPADRAVDTLCGGAAAGFLVGRQPPLRTTSVAAAEAAAGTSGARLADGGRMPAAAAKPWHSPALSARLGNLTPRSSPLPSAPTGAAAPADACPLAAAQVSQPRLDTWPVSLHASTELLRRLLGPLAAAPPALPPPAQVQRWRLLAYALGLAQRAVGAVGAVTGPRDHISMSDALAAAGQVAVDVALAARATHAANLASGAGGGMPCHPIGSESRPHGGAGPGGCGGSRQAAPEAPAPTLPGRPRWGSGTLATPGRSPVEPSCGQGPPSSPLASQASGAATGRGGSVGDRAPGNGAGVTETGGHGAAGQGSQPKEVSASGQGADTRQGQYGRAQRALAALTASLSQFTEFNAAQCDGARRSRRSCGIDRAGVGGGSGRAARTSSTLHAPEPAVPTSGNPSRRLPVEAPASQQPGAATPAVAVTPAQSHGPCSDTCRGQQQTPQTKSQKGRCGDPRRVDSADAERPATSGPHREQNPTISQAGCGVEAGAAAPPSIAAKVDGEGALSNLHAPATAAVVQPAATPTGHRRTGPLSGTVGFDNTGRSRREQASTVPGGPRVTATPPESCVAAAASAPKYVTVVVHDGTAAEQARRWHAQVAAAASAASAQALHLLASIARTAVAQLPTPRDDAGRAPRSAAATATNSSGPVIATTAAAAGAPTRMGIPAGGGLAAVCSVLCPLQAASECGGGATAACTASTLLEPLMQRLLPPPVVDEGLRNSLIAAQPELGFGVLRAVRQVAATRPLEAVPVYLLDEAWRLVLLLQQQRQPQRSQGAPATAERPLLRSACEVDALVALAAALPVSGPEKGAPYKALVGAAAASCQRMLLLTSEGPLGKPVGAAPAAAPGTLAGFGASADDRVFIGPALRRIARLSCRTLEPYPVVELAAQLLVALPKALSTRSLKSGGGGCGEANPARTPTRASHVRRWNTCPYVQRIAATAAFTTAAMLSRTMGSARGRTTAGGGGVSNPVAGSAAPQDAVPLWLVGCPGTQVAQVLLELAAAMHPTVSKATGQVAAAGSKARYGASALRLARELQEVPDAVATVLCCAHRAAALLLSRSGQRQSSTATNAAGAAAGGCAAPQSVQALWTAAGCGARDSSAARQTSGGLTDAEEEEQHRLLVVCTKQLLTVTKCATASTWLLLRRASAVAALGGVTGSGVDDWPAGSAGAAAGNGQDRAGAAAAAPAADALELLEAGASEVCLVVGMWLYYAKDVAKITELLHSSRSRTLQQHARSLGLAGAACQTVWVRLLRCLSDAARPHPPQPQPPPQAGSLDREPGPSPRAAAAGAAAAEATAAPSTAPVPARAALLSLARILQRAFDRVWGGKGNGLASPPSSPSLLSPRSPRGGASSPGAALSPAAGKDGHEATTSGRPTASSAGAQAPGGSGCAGVQEEQLRWQPQGSGAGGRPMDVPGAAGLAGLAATGEPGEPDAAIGEAIPHEPLFLLLGYLSDEESGDDGDGGFGFGNGQCRWSGRASGGGPHQQERDVGLGADAGACKVADRDERGEGPGVGAGPADMDVGRRAASGEAPAGAGDPRRDAAGHSARQPHGPSRTRKRGAGTVTTEEASLAMDEADEGPGGKESPGQGQHRPAEPQQVAQHPRRGQRQQPLPPKRRRLTAEEADRKPATVAERTGARAGVLAAGPAAQSTGLAATAAAAGGPSLKQRRRITPSAVQLRADSDAPEHGGCDGTGTAGGGMAAAAVAAGLRAGAARPEAGARPPEPPKPASKATSAGRAAQPSAANVPDDDAGAAGAKRRRSRAEVAADAAAAATGAAAAAVKPPARRRRSRKQDERSRPPRNAFVAACLRETDGRDSGSDGDWSELEDFIVCQPDRDYGSLFAKKYYYAADEEDEEGDGEGGRE